MLIKNKTTAAKKVTFRYSKVAVAQSHWFSTIHHSWLRLRYGAYLEIKAGPNWRMIRGLFDPT